MKASGSIAAASVVPRQAAPDRYSSDMVGQPHLSNVLSRDAFTRRLSRTDSSIAVLLWSGVMVMAAGLCTIPFGWKPVDAGGAAWFLAAGPFNAAAHFMVIEAFRLGNAAVVAPFRYTGLLWAMLVGFALWREVPDAWMLAGAAVVVCAGIYVLRHGVSKS